MEYHGSDNDDILDQNKLGLPDWADIYGGAGNDRISIGVGNAVGGPGNDAFYGIESAYSTVAYWWSTKGVSVDLAIGVAQDSFGGTDTLFNIYSLAGSGFDDTFIGSGRDEYFAGLGGNDLIVGGGGTDQVTYYSAKSTDAKITYDTSSDTFTVVKNFPNGDRGTDVLKGISAISFTGEGSDYAYVTRNDFIPLNGFLRVPAGSVSAPYGVGVTQVKTGDFNGDGNIDLYMASQVGTGTSTRMASATFSSSTSGMTLLPTPAALTTSSYRTQPQRRSPTLPQRSASNSQPTTPAAWETSTATAIRTCWQIRSVSAMSSISTTKPDTSPRAPTYSPPAFKPIPRQA